MIRAGLRRWETETRRFYSAGSAAMDVTAGHLEQAFPEAYKDLGVRVEPLQNACLAGRLLSITCSLEPWTGLVDCVR